MESSNLIRVRVDLSEMNLPSVTLVWVSVDRSILRTVKDFKHTLYKKFKPSEDRNFNLYLDKCLLLAEETVLILRDGDLVRVVYEDLPSLLDTQCHSSVDFTSNSARCITDDNSCTSLPAAKKLKVSSPVPSLSSVYETHASLSCSKNTDEPQSLPVEMDSYFYQGKTELVHKKRKKHKKLSKEKNNCSENLPLSEEIINDNRASKPHENNVGHYDECDNLLSGEDIQMQEAGIVGDVRETISKRRKKKEIKHSGENRVPLVESVSDTSGAFISKDFADARTSKLGSNFIFCEEFIQNDGDKISRVSEITPLKKFKVNEKNLSSRIISQLEEKCHTPSTLENYVAVQTLSGKLNDTSNLMSIKQNDKCDQFSAESAYNCEDLDSNGNNKSSEVSTVNRNEVADLSYMLPPGVSKNGENILCPSQSSSAIQMEGDCTQSLGNNCPKKKRRRRRKKGPRNLAEPSHSTSGDVLPSSQHGHLKSLLDVIHDVKTEDHNSRKHIRFTSSPESGHSYDVEKEAARLDALGESFESSQESLKAKVSPSLEIDTVFSRFFSPEIETDAVDEKYTPGILLHQDEISSSTTADDTNNLNNEPRKSDTPMKGIKAKNSSGADGESSMNICSSNSARVSAPNVSGPSVVENKYDDKKRVELMLALGHHAQLREKPTEEGFTHDWTVFVKSPGPDTDANIIQHFIDRVVFHLHESYSNPKRVIKEPPYELSDTGFASFLMPIEIFFQNTAEPKKVDFVYDLFLRLDGPPVKNVQFETLTFQNPAEDLCQKLIKAGGKIVTTNGSKLQTDSTKCCKDLSSLNEFPSVGDVTSNGSKLQTGVTKCYKDLPSLNKFPSVGDVIAYKVLELSESYCPEVSDYREGKIVNIDTSTDTLEIELLEEQVTVRIGKFENIYPDETPEPEVTKKVFVNWAKLIEPKLISSSGPL